MACGEAFTNTQHFRRHSSWESILAERWQGAAEDSEEKGAPGRGAEDPRAAAGGFRRDWRQQEPTCELPRLGQGTGTRKKTGYGLEGFRQDLAAAQKGEG